MKSEQGGKAWSNDLYRWREYQFKYNAPMDKIEFCPHKYYTEFNPAGCKYPESPYRCARSPYPNYKVNWSKCNNKFRTDGNNYDNEEFYKIVGDALVWSKKNKKHSRSKRLITSIRHTINLCCLMLNNKDPYLSIKECQAEGAKLEMGYLNQMVTKALDISTKNRMKNGKTSNLYLKGKIGRAHV